MFENMQDDMLGVVTLLADKEYTKKGKSLDGCGLYVSTSIMTRLIWCRLRHTVDIHDVIKVDNMSPNHNGAWKAWDTDTINSIEQWLVQNCSRNYRLIIVPCDEDHLHYHEGKRNRAQFSNMVDAMAFKLRWL